MCFLLCSISRSLCISLYDSQHGSCLRCVPAHHSGGQRQPTPGKPHRPTSSAIYRTGRQADDQGAKRTGSGIGSLHQHLSVRKRKQRKGAGRILEERRAYVRCATQRLCPACPWKRFCPWHQRSTTHSFLFFAINQVSSKHIINCFQHIVLQPAPTEEPGRSAKFDFSIGTETSCQTPDMPAHHRGGQRQPTSGKPHRPTSGTIYLPGRQADDQGAKRAA